MPTSRFDVDLVHDRVRWSVMVEDVDTADVLFQYQAGQPLRTASVGKILLLVHAAREVHQGRLALTEQVTRTAADRVADSGIWQYLAIDTLSVADLCELIGMASDNLATNVLLRRLGLTNVANTAAELGLRATALHDRVRDHRGPQDPATLSTGSAVELVGLLVRLARGETGGPGTSELVLGWLANGLDLSQVAAGWGLDPLAHTDHDRGLLLRHKTGTDSGVRADVGLLTGPEARIAYAVIANWDPADGRDDLRDYVLDRQRALGFRIRRLAEYGHRRW